jgi:type II secretory pathway pseudopilin PulG
VEIMLVVAVIGLLASLAFPYFAKARESARKNLCIENLMQIESAKQRWGLDANKGDGDTPTHEQLIGITGYLRIMPECPAGGTYDFKPIGTPATCTISGHVF